MPRSLADAKTKVTICVTKPVNPALPTITELNAGIQAAASILASDFVFGATDSDKINEKSLASASNANALAASNYQAAMTFFREFDAATGAVDETADATFQAVKVKGTELWIYARRTGKAHSAAWVATDEIFLGAHVITDEPQPPSDLGGYIKNRVPMEVQEAWPFVEAAAGA